MYEDRDLCSHMFSLPTWGSDPLPTISTENNIQTRRQSSSRTIWVENADCQTTRLKRPSGDAGGAVAAVLAPAVLTGFQQAHTL